MSKARRSHNRAVVPKGETAWRQGIFLGRSVTSNEYLLGTEEGTVTARSVRRLANSSRRYNRELMPKRKADIALPQTPNLIPTEETANKSPRLEPSGEVIQEEDEGDFPVQSGPSSASRHTADVGGGDAAPMDLGMSARRAWAGESGEMTPEAKRARVAGIFVGALYSPTEDTIVCEDDVDQAYDDSDNEESKPLSKEEMDEGDAEEFRKMDKYQTYDPVGQKDGMKILDAVWVRTRKPDGSVRCRYCVREFKRGTSTSRVIDIVGIKMGYCFLTADAENAFWQVPIAEEAYMKPPKEWLKKMADSGVDLPDRVVWKLNTEWYGRRIAGQAFVEWAAGHLKEVDFKRNPAAPWMFYNPASGVLMEVYGRLLCHWTQGSFARAGEEAAREDQDEEPNPCELRGRKVDAPQEDPGGHGWWHLPHTPWQVHQRSAEDVGFGRVQPGSNTLPVLRGQGGQQVEWGELENLQGRCWHCPVPLLRQDGRAVCSPGADQGHEGAYGWKPTQAASFGTLPTRHKGLWRVAAQGWRDRDPEGAFRHRLGQLQEDQEELCLCNV